MSNQQNKRPNVPAVPPVKPTPAAVQEPAESDPATDVKVGFRAWFKKPNAANRKALTIMMDQYQDGFLVRQIAALNAEFSAKKPE